MAERKWSKLLRLLPLHWAPLWAPLISPAWWAAPSLAGLTRPAEAVEMAADEPEEADGAEEAQEAQAARGGKPTMTTSQVTVCDRLGRLNLTKAALCVGFWRLGLCWPGLAWLGSTSDAATAAAADVEPGHCDGRPASQPAQAHEPRRQHAHEQRQPAQVGRRTTNAERRTERAAWQARAFAATTTTTTTTRIGRVKAKRMMSFARRDKRMRKMFVVPLLVASAKQTRITST